MKRAPRRVTARVAVKVTARFLSKLGFTTLRFRVSDSMLGESQKLLKTTDVSSRGAHTSHIKAWHYPAVGLQFLEQ